MSLTASVEELYCSPPHRITFPSVSPFPWAVAKFKVAARAHLLLYQRVVTVGSSVWYLLTGGQTHL